MTENYVAQELARLKFGLYYWTSSGVAELDFILQYEDTIYPLEVKSGASSKKKSLQVYIEKYHPNVAIRTSPLNLKLDDRILNCPLYMISELNRLIFFN